MSFVVKEGLEDPRADAAGDARSRVADRDLHGVVAAARHHAHLTVTAGRVACVLGGGSGTPGSFDRDRRRPAFGSGAFPSARGAGGRLLASIAEAHGATPRQVALRFLTRRPSIFTIPKAADIAHVADNAASTSFALSPAEIAQIERAFPREPPRASLPMI
jgi:aryl-alcohol dehydrogenase-like predicted oxidoreductase